MSSPPLLQPVPLHLDSTLGALVIAEILVAVLYGIASVQVYVYLSHSPRDSSFMKGTIFFLWILDSLHLTFTTHGVYHYAVTSFMNPLALTQCPWSFAADMFAGDPIEVIVTLIFAHKIYKLSGSIWPLIFIVPPQLLSWVASIAVAVLELKFPSYHELEQRFAWIWYTVFSLQAFSDCAIAAILCTILIRRRTGFKRTDSLIRTLVLYSINTCALTSSVSVASVVTYAAMPHNFIFIGLGVILPMLMSNSLLALLNSRDMLRDMHAGQVASVHFSRLANILSSSDAPDGRRAAHVRAEGVKEQDIIDIGARVPETSFDSESQVSRGPAI
ncbi:uncharacterized protein PHACADRAFT_210798 [Phanerochaete carnosa HHB-10118-sp]|uniref:DUF6534 domain-containing protein n=1 Tax=Phanerochaete carnosa (strain HHB-10118-sp) TaxID=650164 RepID=K5USZ7_PHACS|nr:uncharacterized protein PHACADRAFT_210798 [Phanerochaete carnosa HHB-10118-sp]EKM53076.1 hypothetical protein PHACADRAFT_210798 [Phanerochaete carnosa HHB-10118-sp]